MKIFVVLILLLAVDTGFCNNNSMKRTNLKQVNTFEYYTKHNTITIPIMIHLDKALVKEYKFKTRIKLKNIFKNVLHNVEVLFQRSSLNQTVRLLLQDVKYLRKSKIAMDENVSKYLKNYCRWQGEKKKRKWYYSVLFTGLDLFYVKNGAKVRSSTGRSYLNGVCSMSRSCSILEWKPHNIHLKLTHEIGHSLGISHDGPSQNQCHGNHIMSAKYSRYNPPKTWSPCSKRDLHRFLASRLSWCVRPGSRN